MIHFKALNLHTGRGKGPRTQFQCVCVVFLTPTDNSQMPPPTWRLYQIPQVKGSVPPEHPPHTKPVVTCASDQPPITTTPSLGLINYLEWLTENPFNHQVTDLIWRILKKSNQEMKRYKGQGQGQRCSHPWGAWGLSKACIRVWFPNREAPDKELSFCVFVEISFHKHDNWLTHCPWIIGSASSPISCMGWDWRIQASNPHFVSPGNQPPQ